jgi:hypothetical protein
MDTATIIEQIDAEISQLQQAKVILAGTSVKRAQGRPKTIHTASKTVAEKPAKRVMSAEGKAKMAKAQKARWAKVKKAAKKIATKTSTAL